MLFNHVLTLLQLGESTGVVRAYVRTCKTQLPDTTTIVRGCCNIAVQSCYFIIPWQHVLSCMNNAVAGFIMMVPTTLFKSVRLSCHEQFVPTCMNKPVNNTVQAGQLNQCWSLSTTHVQAGQLNHVQACQQPCSSWPAQPCSSLSTTMFKLVSSTMFKPVHNHVQAGQLNHVHACQQAKTSCAFLHV